jgi:hypothetical protein
LSATSSIFWLSAVAERSSRSCASLDNSATLSESVRSVSRSAEVLIEYSSSVPRNCSLSDFSRASSAKIVEVFSPNSTFSRLMTSVFFPISASWLVVFVFICSTLISSRRVDIANSARNWSLSAWISAIESGVDASSRRMVSRTARLCTSGMKMTPRRLARRNPIAKYIAGSIMRDTLTQTRQNPCYRGTTKRAKPCGA